MNSPDDARFFYVIVLALLTVALFAFAFFVGKPMREQLVKLDPASEEYKNLQKRLRAKALKVAIVIGAIMFPFIWLRMIYDKDGGKLLSDLVSIL